MLGIGFSEMILIAGIALVIIGPEKFPEFAKLVIRTVRDLRGYVDDVKKEVTKELTPIKKEMDALSRIDPEKYIDSLTNSDDKPKKSSKTLSNPSVNEEDRKIMAAADADAYGEDPYGWEEGGKNHYGADKGAYPEDTVGYGAVDATDGEGDDVDARDSEAGCSDVAEADESAGETAGESDPPPADGVELGDNRIEVMDPGEPDAWTGR